MTQQKRGLGRSLGDMGLTELLSDLNNPTPKSNDDTVALQNLALADIQPGRYQPRQQISPQALTELADSIREQGIIQPIIVRRHGDNYEIIAGERRWRAAQLAGLDTVPAIVQNVSDGTAMAMALIENIQRQDLNAIEEAMALQRLVDEFALTHQEIAKAVGKSRASVTNLLRLLKLSPEVRVMLESGDLDMGHARALLALTEPQQTRVAKQIVTRGLAVRDVEQLIRQSQLLHSTTAHIATVDPDIDRLQTELSEKLAATVTIQHKTTGKGKLVIRYSSLEELAGILEKIK